MVEIVYRRYAEEFERCRYVCDQLSNCSLQISLMSELKGMTRK